jgi:hypothetical protein
MTILIQPDTLNNGFIETLSMNFSQYNNTHNYAQHNVQYCIVNCFAECRNSHHAGCHATWHQVKLVEKKFCSTGLQLVYIDF